MKQLYKTSPKFILSGGGTGGHIYPAIAIANALKHRFEGAEFLFVGAENKMEMQKVPKAGYSIKGLNIAGIQRSNLFKNITLPYKIISSVKASNQILKEFQPDMVIGTGGFASGPIMWTAGKKGIPILIQEQNAFAGITNKLVKNKAFAICTAYDGMQQFFPKEKIHITGNPIRTEMFSRLPDAKHAKSKFNLVANKPVILSVGGSLGASSLNKAWGKAIDKLVRNDVQLIWQTGKLDFHKIQSNAALKQNGIHMTEFIYDMQNAYAAADIIVSRAGAMAISELALIGKPVILVPYPHAAEDHQTKNAENLVEKSAAIMVGDAAVENDLVEQALALLRDSKKQETLSSELKKLAKPHATENIVNIIEQKLQSK